MFLNHRQPCTPLAIFLVFFCWPFLKPPSSSPVLVLLSCDKNWRFYSCHSFPSSSFRCSFLAGRCVSPRTLRDSSGVLPSCPFVCRYSCAHDLLLRQDDVDEVRFMSSQSLLNSIFSMVSPYFPNQDTASSSLTSPYSCSSSSIPSFVSSPPLRPLFLLRYLHHVLVRH